MRIYPFNGKKGRFTWECEGSPDPFAKHFNMFEPHVPSDASGITICGYDFWQNRKTVADDLAQTGITGYLYRLMVDRWSQRTGEKARQELADSAVFVAQLSGMKLELVTLFEIAYTRKIETMNRIRTKPAVVSKFGTIPECPEWLDILEVDGYFRGDITGRQREWLYPLMVAENWQGVARVWTDRQLWSNVPEDRFQRRAEFAREGLESMQPVIPQKIELARGFLQDAMAALDNV